MRLYLFQLILLILPGYSDAYRENAPCAYSFHVWNPGNDIVQKVKDVNNRVENVSGHFDREFLKMKVVVLEELKQCQNWTINLEREISDLKMKSIRGRIIERDTSSSMTDVERNIVDLRKKVGHLKNNFNRMQKDVADIRTNINKPQMGPLSQQDTSMLNVIENAVRDLKAEWVILKRDVIQVQMEQREVKLGQNMHSNNSFYTSKSIDVMSSRLSKLENDNINLTSTIRVLSNAAENCSNKMKSQESKLNKSQIMEENMKNQIRHMEGVLDDLKRDFRLMKDDNGYIKQLIVENSKSTNPRKAQEFIKNERKRIHSSEPPKDCQDIFELGYDVSGVYQIQPDGSADLDNIYCEFLNGTAYTVIQRRADGLLSFNRQWVEYKFGFGNLYGSHWIGNEWIHQLTNQNEYTLRVDMWDWEGKKYFAEYSMFDVGGQKTDYELHVGGYMGNAGDSFSFHDGMKFSTEDMDNDLNVRHCAVENKSGWWFNNCYLSNLNGVYHVGYYSHTQYSDGIVWFTLKEDDKYSLRKVEMKLRKNNI